MAEALRVLLDTNIYGAFVGDEPELALKVASSEKIKVYGCNVIRNELRDTPKEKQFNGRKLRMLLLQSYDEMVGEHELPVNQSTIDLANEYSTEFKGNISKEKLFKDFLIVAVAAIGKLAIVCTKDRRTMASEHARECYQKVNQKYSLETPQLISIEALKKMV